MAGRKKGTMSDMNDWIRGQAGLQPAEPDNEEGPKLVARGMLEQSDTGEDEPRTIARGNAGSGHGQGYHRIVRPNQRMNNWIRSGRWPIHGKGELA